jgi:hypothetical protein
MAAAIDHARHVVGAEEGDCLETLGFISALS